MLRLKLRGPAGNRAAIGARVQLELTDGTVQTAEVYAGGGFGSQSAAACFFGYPESNPPKQCRVRWPSGATTVHPVTAGTAQLILAVPLR